MPLLKQKELHSVVFGLNVHKPDKNETMVMLAVTLLLMVILNKLFPMPIAWFFVGIIGLTTATFDLIPSTSKISSLICGLVIGFTAAQFNFLILK
ncbi:hypothetical protein V0M98_38480 (plasmid) [Pseudomonas silesiensis]|uniref:hypothetical protein n=1 Tax=Pseudomonas silesiensis TaxID=1853130 RepID=UPI0030D51CE8